MQGIKGTPESMRKMNTTHLYQALIELRTATRAELAEKTKLSTTTVRALLEELMQSGELLALELDESSGGRRARRYTLNPVRNLTLCLYFEETRVLYRINDLLGNIVEEDEAAIEEDEAAEAVLGLIAACRAKHAIRAIGLGVPGVVENGRYYASSGINQWEVNTIGEQVERTFNLPVLLENDLNCIALGFALEDARWNPSHRIEEMNLAYIHFNQACAGAGIIADGRVVHGAKQFAGEVGFLPLGPDMTLDRVLHHAKGQEELTEAVARVISIVNCITNPSLVIIGGERLENNSLDIEKLTRRAKHYIYNMIQPEIRFSTEYRGNYLTGLSYLTIQELIPRLPL